MNNNNIYKKPFVTAIIVAGGNSTRMGNNKQLMEIGDKSILAHSIYAFDVTNNVNSIVVVCRKEDKEAVYEMVDKHKFAKVASIVTGGDYRQASVFNGVKVSPPGTTHFAIHDGARALITPDKIHDVISDAIIFKAATLGVMLKDTVKIIDNNKIIRGTADRRKLFTIQTPQVFEKKLYLDGVKLAIKEDKIYSDDCQLIERLRLPIHITNGSYDNIKITTFSDYATAQIIYKQREEK